MIERAEVVNGPELWPEATSIDVIRSTEEFIRRYCVLHNAAYLPLATWCLATHLAEQFDAFPYLALQSPVKGCGKTRLQEVMEQLCARPWRGTAPTPAALFRMMENCPTLFLDEIEGLNAARNASETQQTLLAILNAGHRRGATVPRCCGRDAHLEYFRAYGPKAFAVIGRLPDTLADRSIIITLQRRRPNQPVDRFLVRRATTLAEPIRDVLVVWADQNDEYVRAAYDGLPDLAFLSDRDADLWMPLFATCSVASPDRVRELKACAIALTDAKHADDLDRSIQLRLLADIDAVWPLKATHIGSADLLAKLLTIEDSPWHEFGLTPRQLAKWLRPFQVRPRQVRIGTNTVKGYLRSEFDEALSRYAAGGTGEAETCETTA